jgi:hypothetical protein
MQRIAQGGRAAACVLLVLGLSAGAPRSMREVRLGLPAISRVSNEGATADSCTVRTFDKTTGKFKLTKYPADSRQCGAIVTTGTSIITDPKMYIVSDSVGLDGGYELIRDNMKIFVTMPSPKADGAPKVFIRVVQDMAGAIK